jgi:hypothetical protein
VFGGIRRNVEWLQAQSDNQRFQLEANYLGLTSNIALAAIQEASLRGQIDAARKLIQIANDVLKLPRTTVRRRPGRPVGRAGSGGGVGADRADAAAVGAAACAAKPSDFGADRRSFKRGAAGEIHACHAQAARDLPLSVQLVQQRPENAADSLSALANDAVALPKAVAAEDAGAAGLHVRRQIDGDERWLLATLAATLKRQLTLSA